MICEDNENIHTFKHVSYAFSVQPESPMKKAVGYIRARKYMGEWASDHVLQRKQMELFAEAEGYELIDTYSEDQKFSIANKTGALVLSKALKRCKREKVDLLYIDIGRLRRNPVFSDVAKNHDVQSATNKPLPFKMVPIPAARETIEAIERHARFELYDFRYRRTRAKRKPRIPDDPISIWQRENKVGTKRLKNFKHLYDGVAPIYKVIQANLDLKPRKIAEVLNSEYYMTVDGRRWNRDNTRKTMDLISTDLFREYVGLREQAKPEKMDVRVT